MKRKVVEPNTQKLKLVIKKLGEILGQHDEHFWEEQVRELEGWPSGYQEYAVGDLVVQTAYGIYQLSNTVLPNIKEAEILENIIRPTKSKVTLQPKTLLNYVQLCCAYV